MKVNIITASHDDEILKNNLGRSEFFKNTTILTGFSNVAKAYNIGNRNCEINEYNFFVHHDVFLPENFKTNFKMAILEINSFDSNWGVLGVAGAIIENGKRSFYGHVKDRGREWGTSVGLPREVQTLDELLLITKGDLLFDEQFDLHFYGADICMRAIKQGRKNYVIDAYCHHNSGLPLGYRSRSFKDCEAKFKNKFKDMLPVVTTCALINEWI